MSKPRISAIMPVYNGVKYIEASIGSIVAQTLPPTELFVIDDGSTDGSQELLEKIPTPFPKIVLHQANKRQSAARNLAAARATGDYLAFLDHDDIWYPQHLERLVEPLEKDARMGWSYSDIDEIDAEGKLVSLRILGGLNTQVQHPKTCLLNMLSNDMFIFPSASLVRRKAFEAVGGFDERLSGYEDDDLFLRIFREGWLNVFLPDSQVRYRRHPNSSTYSERMWMSRDIFASKLIDTYPNDPELRRYYVRDLIAPRFFRCAKAEYFRHFPHGRYAQCARALALMRQFAGMMSAPRGKRRIRHAVGFQLLKFPRVLEVLYPFLERFSLLPHF